MTDPTETQLIEEALEAHAGECEITFTVEELDRFRDQVIGECIRTVGMVRSIREESAYGSSPQEHNALLHVITELDAIRRAVAK